MIAVTSARIVSTGRSARPVTTHAITPTSAIKIGIAHQSVVLRVSTELTMAFDGAVATRKAPTESSPIRTVRGRKS